MELYLFNDFEQEKKKTKQITPKKEPLKKKVERAISLLQMAATNSSEPIEISYSGGKDSDVILELARMAGINYKAIYKNTTIDPPGTIIHCLNNGVEIIRRKTFAQVIREKGFPTFIRRFCCSELKEYKLFNRAVQGIRQCESIKRAKLYKEPTICRLYNKKEHVEVFLPILWWTDEDVTNFIKERNIHCHPIYYDKDGHFNPKHRLGCMGCPQKSDRGLSDFKANPRLVKFWLKNGEIWWNTHKLRKAKKKFKNHYELFVRNIFFEKYEDFQDAINNMFENIDCKQFLEQYFNIKL